MTPSAVLGVSCDFHDAAAALVVDGSIVAAVAEERFTRQKHDPSLPVHAIAWCLQQGNISSDGLSHVVFYDKPLSAFERFLWTQARVGPRGIAELSRALPTWYRRRLAVTYRIQRTLAKLGMRPPRVLFAEHHMSHAASAFYASPFDRAAIVTFDGVGEWTTTSIGIGMANRIEFLAEQRFPDSLGLWYSTFTAYCGFDVNDGEYKLMGLAPFGDPRFVDVLRDKVIRIHDDGSIQLDRRYFAFMRGRRMFSRRLVELLGHDPVRFGDVPTQFHADLAASVQAITAESHAKTIRHAMEVTGERQVCLAGGVALNAVANGAIFRSGQCEDLWVQPAAGDDGGALGAALWGWYQWARQPRPPRRGVDMMRGARLGPAFDPATIEEWLTTNAIASEHPDSDADLHRLVADALAEGQIVGWFNASMEFGPRALGGRSILADPRHAQTIQRLNLRVKGREGFRPFAPVVRSIDAERYFDFGNGDPSSAGLAFMNVVVNVRGAESEPPDGRSGTFAERLGAHRSVIDACTHVDGSARVQVLHDEDDQLWALLGAVAERTGVGVLLNTSFNRAGEPIVLSPADALRSADAAGLDLLVIDGFMIHDPSTQLGADDGGDQGSSGAPMGKNAEASVVQAS